MKIFLFTPTIKKRRLITEIIEKSRSCYHTKTYDVQLWLHILLYELEKTRTIEYLAVYGRASMGESWLLESHLAAAKGATKNTAMDEFQGTLIYFIQKWQVTGQYMKQINESSGIVGIPLPSGCCSFVLDLSRTFRVWFRTTYKHKTFGNTPEHITMHIDSRQRRNKYG